MILQKHSDFTGTTHVVHKLKRIIIRVPLTIATTRIIKLLHQKDITDNLHNIIVWHLAYLVEL